LTDLELYIKSYFGVVQKEELQTIVSLFKSETLTKGDFYLKTGKNSDRLSFVKTGLLRIFVTTPEKEITQWISNKGSFVTDLSGFVFEKPARWNIQALTEVEVYSIYRRDYLELGRLVPNWHILEKLFIARCFSMLEDRIFSHLSMSAEERYHYFFENNKELFLQVPLQYIASMLGMTAETFSRIRKLKE